MKKAVKIIIITAAVFLALNIAAANVLYSVVLVPDSPISIQKLIMKQLDGKSSAVDTSRYSGFAGDDATKDWFEKNRTDVYIDSNDGLKLHAYEFINNEDNACGRFAVICHGFSSEAKHMKNSIKAFYERGYSVIAPDARAHGESEGKVRGMGWPERRDIIGWLNYINKTFPGNDIILYGVSMGASTVVMTSGEKDLPENVKAVIEDCGYSSVWDEFSLQMKNMFHLPTFPLLNICSATVRLRAGYGFKEADAAGQLKNCSVPTLFIHGDADDFVPFEMLDILYEAAPCKKEKLVIKGAGHAMSSSADPELYWAAVDSFLDENIK